VSELVLISIHPRHVEAILAGEKTIEFRRRWTARAVSHLVIYATVPMKQIVAVVPIEETVQGSPTALWNLARQHGGGVTRAELFTYFSGLQEGFGLRLGRVKPLRRPIDPFVKFDGFRAPQSYRFVTTKEASVLRLALK